MSPVLTTPENPVHIDWDDIHLDLKTERAVLILGPEFHNINGISMKEHIYNELLKRPDHGILHFYPSNGIFLFQSAHAKSRAQKVASQLYDQFQPDYDLIDKIIDLPFKLVISTCPNRLLENRYRARNVECQFDYYAWKPRKNKTEIAFPDKYSPLIYNIFGSTESHESLVLDFEDLFEHLRNLLNNINVPEEIRFTLNETETFILLGFHLEKWDTQLLLRYLNMKKHDFDDSKKNYTTDLINVDHHEESFFRQVFNLKYYGLPVEFITQLHQHYFAMEVREDQQHIGHLAPGKVIERYIAQDDIQKALNYLTSIVPDGNPELHQHLILLKSNYTRYMYLRSRRLETTEMLEIQRNKIKQGILHFIVNL